MKAVHVIFLKKTVWVKLTSQSWPLDRLLCFKFFLQDLLEGISWGQVFFPYVQAGLVNITKCPSAQVFQLMLPKAATRWQHFFMPTRALGQILFWVVNKNEYIQGCVSFLPSLWAFIPRQISTIATLLCRRSCPLSGVTLRKEAGGGNPATRRHGAQSTLQSSSSPETPPSFGGARVGSAAGGSPDLEIVGSCRGEQAVQVHGVGGCLPGKPSPAPSAQDSPAWGPKPAQTPGMWHQPRSPRPDGNRVSSSFLLY